MRLLHEQRAQIGAARSLAEARSRVPAPPPLARVKREYPIPGQVVSLRFVRVQREAQIAIAATRPFAETPSDGTVASTSSAERYTGERDTAHRYR